MGRGEGVHAAAALRHGEEHHACRGRPACTASASIRIPGRWMLYDGRNRAQNGWFVLRTLIPAGKTDRRRGLAHPPGRDSELDAAAHGGAQPGGLCAGLRRRSPSSNWIRSSMRPRRRRCCGWGRTAPTSRCFEGPVSDRTPLAALRLREVRFLLRQGTRAVCDRVRRNGPSCSPSPETSTAKTWQSEPGHATSPWQMDHVSVREGYRLWHGVSHLDDARQAPPNRHTSTGGRWAPNTDSPLQARRAHPGPECRRLV